MDFSKLIRRYRQGSRKEYDKFISLLCDPGVTDEILCLSLKSIKDCVILLDKEQEMLVGVVLNLDWTSRPKFVVEIYQSLILNLISVHTDYLCACLRMIIKQFRPTNLVTDKTETDKHQDVLAKNNQIFMHLHSLLEAITRLVPMSSSVIMSLLTDMFPYMTKDVYTQESYMINALQISYYLPNLRQQIMELVIDKLMKFDVRAPRSQILEDKRCDDEIIFKMDETSVGHETVSKLEEAEKLDVMMVHFFEYINRTCYKNGELQWEVTKRLYRELLFVFEKCILPTFGCSHVQFIMFYMVSMKSELCDGFIDYLWKLVQNPNKQAIYRQSAVSYIGSLLARGKFVSLGTVQKTLQLLMQWTHSYTHVRQDNYMADITHHGPFYSVCQAVFYVFAFRQRELLESKKGWKWAESLQFPHLIQNRLNPLKVCTPVVVKTFASVTRQHQLAFCDHIIQQNARSFLPVVSDGTHKILESYFPFDPYLLTRSSKYIEPNYREYDNSVEIEDNSSGEEDDDMFTEDAMSPIKNVVSPTSTGHVIEKSQLDFLNYGTSPGFKN